MEEEDQEAELITRRLSARKISVADRVRQSSILSNPPQILATTNAELREFIQEQRKIIASFRSQPWPIQMKMQAIENYKENILKYMPQLSGLDAFREKSSRAVHNEQKRLNNFLSHFIIWRSVIRKIEANFGTNVGSYFRLVRWLCMLNLALSLLSFMFVVIPQLVVGHGLDIPSYIRGNLTAYSYLIDGEGYLLEYSFLFYGYYDSGQNETYVAPPHNPAPYIGTGYRLPLAYLLITLAAFIISGGAILYSIARQYKSVQQAKLGGTGRFAFSWRVFASWDYTIIDPKKVKNKMRAHGIGLKEALFDVNKEEDFSTRATTKRAITHLITNIIVTILLFGSGYAIFVAADNANQTTDSGSFDLENLGPETILQFLRSFQLQIVIVLRNFMIPLMFKFIALHEKFHPRTALKLRLLRLFVLYFSSLYVVLISLFVLSRSCRERQQEVICRCWETNVGQEMYKLMLIQTLAEVGSILLVEGAHWGFTKLSNRYCIRVGQLAEKVIGNIEFEVSVSVLKLVYGQGLIFFGVLFCPILPILGFVRNIIIFYLRMVAVFVFDKPPTTFFRVASTHNFYMTILFITVFISCLPVGFAMVEMTPSLSCGPFRGLDNMLQIISNEIKRFPDLLQTIINYIQTATIIIPVMTLLSIAIYYYAALANALKKVNKDLLLQLKVEQNETRKIIAENLTTQADNSSAGIGSVDVEETEKRVTLAELSRLSLGIVKFPAMTTERARRKSIAQSSTENEDMPVLRRLSDTAAFHSMEKLGITIGKSPTSTSDKNDAHIERTISDPKRMSTREREPDKLKKSSGPGKKKFTLVATTSGVPQNKLSRRESVSMIDNIVSMGGHSTPRGSMIESWKAQVETSRGPAASTSEGRATTKPPEMSSPPPSDVSHSLSKDAIKPISTYPSAENMDYLLPPKAKKKGKKLPSSTQSSPPKQDRPPPSPPPPPSSSPHTAASSRSSSPKPGPPPRQVSEESAGESETSPVRSTRRRRHRQMIEPTSSDESIDQ